MAVTWGAWAGGVRVGIDFTRSSRTLTFYYHVEVSGAGVSSGTVTLSGAITGTTTYLIEGSGTALVATRSFTGSWSRSYTVTAKTGAASHSRTASIPSAPVTAPDAPGRPTISAITHNTASTLWSVPDMGNGSFVRYEWQIAANSGFSPVHSATSPTTNGQNVVGLSRATTYWVRVRAVTTTATGPWSQSASFTTNAVAPSAPPTPTVSGVTNTGSTLYWNHSSNNGGASLVGYDVQVATAANFNSGSLLIDYTRQTGGSNGVTFPIVALPVNTALWARVRAENAAGLKSAWSGVRSWSTLPNSPATPSSVAATRSSDTSHTISWVRNASSVAPYDSIEVQRSTNGGSYATVASLTGTATSWADTSTVANNSYRWRVRAVNGAGSSSYASTAALVTTPAAPLNVAAVKSATIDVEVSWTPATPYAAAGYNIQDNPGGAGWTTVATVGAVTSWTHVSPDLNVTHQYRVRAISAGPTLYSSWSTPSGVLAVAGAPFAPTPVLPASVQDRAKAVTFTWIHRPSDTAPQTGYELRYRVNSGAWTTLSGSGSVASRSITARNVSGSLDWQIRTVGVAAAGYGPWSPVHTVQLASAPVISIATPDGGDHPSSAVAVVWSYSNADVSAQAQWRARLIHDSDILETRSGAGTATTIAFGTVLQDATEYRIEVEAAAGTGVWSATASVDFLTDFALPVTPELATVWDPESGSASVSLYNPVPVPGGLVETVYNLIQRRIDGGEWLTLAEVEIDGAWVDPIPPLSGVLEYRALAVSALPSVAASPPQLVTQVDVGRTFFNWGSGFGQQAWFEGNPQVSVSAARNRAVRPRAGRVLPRELIGSQLSRQYSFSAVVTPASAQTRDVEEGLLVAGTVVCYRDPDGRKAFVGGVSGSTGHAGAGVALGSSSGRGWTLDQVQLNFSEVDYLEGLDVGD